jgi:hypothetical protein
MDGAFVACKPIARMARSCKSDAFRTAPHLRPAARIGYTHARKPAFTGGESRSTWHKAETFLPN